jgi:helix-turn-helix protein
MRNATIEALNPAELLDEKESARLLTIQPATLATWRSKHTQALPYVKIGRCIRYRKSDLLAFIDAQTHGAFNDAGE